MNTPTLTIGNACDKTLVPLARLAELLAPSIAMPLNMLRTMRPTATPMIIRTGLIPLLIANHITPLGRNQLLNCLYLRVYMCYLSRALRRKTREYGKHETHKY